MQVPSNNLAAAIRYPVKNEERAWTEIGQICAAVDCTKGDQKTVFREWVFALAIVYRNQTGLIPAFTNAEKGTRFERFVLTIPKPDGLRVTRNLVKAAIRHWDFKRNETFIAQRPDHTAD